MVAEEPPMTGSGIPIPMSFAHPWMLLLLVLPAMAVLIWRRPRREIAVRAVRKSLYDSPVPSRADDFETAVSTRIKGFSCVYNANAVAAEPTPNDSSQYHRLVRIVSWMIGSAFSLLWKALKAGRVGLAVQLAVHKILRWNMGVFAIMASIAGIALGFLDSFSNTFFLSVMVFNMLAFAGWLLKNSMPSALRLPYFFWLMCIASLTGIFKALQAKSAAVWDHSAR